MAPAITAAAPVKMTIAPSASRPRSRYVRRQGWRQRPRSRRAGHARRRFLEPGPGRAWCARTIAARPSRTAGSPPGRGRGRCPTAERLEDRLARDRCGEFVDLGRGRRRQLAPDDKPDFLQSLEVLGQHIGADARQTGAQIAERFGSEHQFAHHQVAPSARRPDRVHAVARAGVVIAAVGSLGVSYLFSTPWLLLITKAATKVKSTSRGEREMKTSKLILRWPVAGRRRTTAFDESIGREDEWFGDGSTSCMCLVDHLWRTMMHERFWDSC